LKKQQKPLFSQCSRCKYFTSPFVIKAEENKCLMTVFYLQAPIFGKGYDNPRILGLVSQDLGGLQYDKRGGFVV
jgi:hypothetical protein